MSVACRSLLSSTPHFTESRYTVEYTLTTSIHGLPQITVEVIRLAEGKPRGPLLSATLLDETRLLYYSTARNTSGTPSDRKPPRLG